MKIKEFVRLKQLTTFRIGGRARYFCSPKDSQEFLEAVLLAKKVNLPIFILGGGANILFSDGVVNRVVVSTKRWNRMEREGNRVRFGAGVSIEKANRFLIKQRLSGMEFSGGLPGTVGGAVYMNARCYDHDFAEIIETVTVVDQMGKQMVLTKEEIGYGYKKSIFMEHSEFCIVEVVFSLTTKSKEEIRKVYKSRKLDRKMKGQYAFPSAGCVFKNNYQVGISSGRLIDESGLKGVSVGGAAVYQKHANFIINRNRATAEDVKKLILEIQRKVSLEKGVDLELELQMIE